MADARVSTVAPWSPGDAMPSLQRNGQPRPRATIDPCGLSAWLGRDPIRRNLSARHVHSSPFHRISTAPGFPLTWRPGPTCRTLTREGPARGEPSALVRADGTSIYRLLHRRQQEGSILPVVNAVARDLPSLIDAGRCQKCPAGVVRNLRLERRSRVPEALLFVGADRSSQRHRVASTTSLKRKRLRDYRGAHVVGQPSVRRSGAERPHRAVSSRSYLPPSYLNETLTLAR
jgi:hypothetical protein